MAEELPCRRKAERGQFEDVVGAVGAQDAGVLHHQCKENAEDNSREVQSYHYQSLVPWEEGCDHKQVHREPRRAGHERNHQHREGPVLGVMYLLCGHYGGDVAAEAQQHRHEGIAVKADDVHQLIHKICSAGHIAGVFKKREEEEQQDYVRKERNY